MKGLYKLHYDCGRGDTILDLFVSEIDYIDKLIENDKNNQE